ncbi:5136_t:CDS:2, partial [Racocetra fulgida]
KTLGCVGVVADVAETIGMNIDKSEENDVMVSLAKNNKIYEINGGEPEYSPDPNNERAQESRFVGDLNNKVSEDKMMVLMKAPLGVITKIDTLMKGFVKALRK